ncbi:hypothetical protein A7P53_00060 [Acinetobacter defluvii]|uniref:hypothetical protein n=1 Tax=Acinetobacter defluvii TaxID=1871111 RepID=UPI00148F8E40|nr:hypothetical protein [Acinetobacter defluvii]NNP71286.1 hypothetical protein [Acinetobacter defluvii]
MKVKEIIVNIVAVILIVMFFITMFVFILFHYANSATALKDSLTTLGSFFSGIATLTTAYVAFILYSDWRFAKKFDIQLSYLNRIQDNAIKLRSIIHSHRYFFLESIYRSKSDSFNFKEYSKLTLDLQHIHGDIIYYSENIVCDIENLSSLVNFQLDLDGGDVLSKINELDAVNIQEEEFYSVFEGGYCFKKIENYYNFLTYDYHDFLYSKIIKSCVISSSLILFAKK